MARKPMVTRTIVTTEAEVMCVDIKSGETFNNTVEVPRTYSSDEKLMKVVRPMIETEDVKAVHIIEQRTKETLYGMAEEDFIKNAEVLPAREKATVEAE